MSATFSWGRNTDYRGRVIDANATELELPHSATDADIEVIAQLCKQLQKLDLSHCEKMTHAGLQHVARLSQLLTLNLCEYSKSATDAGLGHLTTLKQLQTLDLVGCKQITDYGLQIIASLAQLQMFWIVYEFFVLFWKKNAPRE